MTVLIKNITDLITCENLSRKPKHGKDQSDIGLIKNGFILYNDDKILHKGRMLELKHFLKQNKIKIKNEIDAKNNVVMPGFIDTHTHFVFAGSRSDEYEMRIKGLTYEQITAKGGGIKATVKSVRDISKEKLIEITLKRLKKFVTYGTTTIEGKSGYGLDLKNEMKILEVIKFFKDNNPYNLDIFSTFLGAHSFPEGRNKNEYIEEICEQMIPEITKRRLATFIDVFCEKNYFSTKDTDRILKVGKKYGLIPKLHTDQFNSIGGIEIALKNKAISVDHLEVVKLSDIKLLANANYNIIATLLPGVSYFLNINYPPARKLIENNVPIALATDFNPGSCMTENMQIIMSLASIKMRMTIEEIITAVTINAAYAINFQNSAGSIEKGKQADLLIFDTPSYKDIVYNFGVNQIKTVIKKGKIIYKN
ncbi:MAG: imidazolonepropionase [Ignavibacteria bacterium]|nr:imidazolonepropionase [Ignavibacteria bacterium]